MEKITTGLRTFTIKFCAIFIIVCTFFSTFLINVSATNEYLVTLLIKPDKSISYTDYDSAYMTVLCNNTGKTYSFVLYPYNNFSDKVVLPEGTYSVLDVGITGKNDLIFESTSEDVVVNRAVAIVASLKDSKIIETTTITTTTTNKTTTTTEKDNVKIPTLFSTTNVSNSSNINDVTINSTSTQKTENNITSTTTTPYNNENAKQKTALSVSLIVGAGALALAIFIFFIMLYKKNKKE